MSLNGKYATKKEKESIIWVAILHVEAMTINLIISNRIIMSGHNNLQLFDRIEFLSQKWTDPEIIFILLNILTTQNLYSQSEIINRINTFSKKLFKTPKNHTL